VRELAYKNGSGAALPSGWDVSKNPYIGTTRTDWIDAITRTAPFQRHYITLSGGSETLTNRLSFLYTDNEGTLLNTFHKELNLRYDATYKFGKHIRLREDAFFKTWDNRSTSTDSGGGGVISGALTMPRSAEAYYSDGTFGGTAPKDQEYKDKYGSNFADLHGDNINPLRILLAESLLRKPITFNSSTFLEIADVIPGLKFTSRFTYKLDKTFDKTFTPMRTEPGKPLLNNSVSYESSTFYKWEVENTLNYDKVFGDHHVGALVSTTANKQRGLSFGTSNGMLENEDSIYQDLESGTSGMS
jgi:hypothetical protein